MDHTESTAPNQPDAAASDPGDAEVLPQHRARVHAEFGAGLASARASLLISTYQAGKVVVVSEDVAADGYGLRLSCHNFERAMGIAVGPGRLAVARGRSSGSSETPPRSLPDSIRRELSTPAT